MTDTALAPPSTARVFNVNILPAVADGDVPFWRIVLRGCSQCCFQTNEVTGLIFLIALLTYSWEQSLLMLMGALIGATVGLALRAERVLLELGLFGFNSCLMALALGNFFERDAALWIAAAVLCAVVSLVAWLMMRFFPYPVLAAPFILVFWIVWPFAEDLGLTKLEFAPFVDEDVFPIQAGFAAMGAALFAGTLLAGVLFFVAVAVSSWRDALLAFAAAMTAHSIAVWWLVPGQEINSGLAGFNAVLAAVAIYEFAGFDIRLALLGAIVASAILPLFTQLDLISLAAGFVLTTWAILFLGWFQDRWFNPRPTAIDTT